MSTKTHLVHMPEGLHPDTASLVTRFAVALAEKLHAAEKKYGYSNRWMEDDWLRECRVKLRDHLEKGDPRDVAAYCAFLWHHGELTVALPNKYLAGALVRMATELKEAVDAGDVKRVTAMRQAIIDSAEGMR